MEELFLHVLNRSLTGSWLLLCVLMLQPLVKKAPDWLRGTLWALTALRLVCPFVLPVPIGFAPSAEPVPQGMLYAASPAVDTGIAALDDAVNPLLSAQLSPEAGDSVNPVQVLVFAGSVIWLCGMLVMLLTAAVSWLNLHRKVRTSLPMGEGIRICEGIPSPFLFGLFRPRIYLPAHLPEETAQYVIAHERAHLRRHDHWKKPLGYLVLALHWFNPLVWIGFILFCRDAEHACDEMVIREMGTSHKKPYAHALISCSTGHGRPSPCPVAFGEEAVQHRVRHVLHYQKPAFWVILAAALAGLSAVVCFFGTRWEPDDGLKTYIDSCIASHHQNGRASEHYAAVSWELLGTKQRGSHRTLYMWVCYREYSYDGDLVLESGSHIPTAITVKKEDGAWRLIEYWEAEDGSRYVPSIREKFPIHLWGKGTDSQRYVQKQCEECDRMARAYFENEAANVKGRNMTYCYDRSPEQFPPELVLFQDGTFRFTYSYFSSDLPMGTYAFRNGGIILTTSDDPPRIYVFDGAEDGFVFNAEQSSPIPSYRYSSDAKEPECPVPDGALFLPAK